MAKFKAMNPTKIPIDETRLVPPRFAICFRCSSSSRWRERTSLMTRMARERYH
jgi:hypothetical protein